MKDNRIEKLKRLLKQVKPRRINKFQWERRLDAIRQELYNLENNIPMAPLPKNSNAYGKTFWNVAEKNEMRHSLSNTWGVSKTGVPVQVVTKAPPLIK